MPKRLGILALAAAAAAVATAAAPTWAGSVRSTVLGRFASQTQAGVERGRFQLVSRAYDRGEVYERVVVECRKLDVRKVAGATPQYRLFLTAKGASEATDFGTLRVDSRGDGRYLFASRYDAYPEGVDLVADFGGGRIEVRSGDLTVLSGDVPAFVDLDDGNSEGSGARAVRRDASRLSAAPNGRGRGWVEARLANTPRGTFEELRVQIAGLARSVAPYSVVCIASDATETEIAELTPRGRYGDDREVIDTRTGAEIPGGRGLAGLSEQRVEVRDRDGNVALSGTFPTVEVE